MIREKLLLLKSRKYSALGYKRLINLKRLAKRCGELEGCYVEMGCYKGGSAAAVTPIFQKQEKEVWLFDSFEGLPKPNPKLDINFKGNQWTFNNNRASVNDVYHSYWYYGVCLEGVNIVKGWFNKTIPKHKKKIGEIAMLHVDCDWYASVKLVLEELYGQVEKGGYIIIDDYGHWQGCKKAVEEFRKKNNITSKIHKVDYTAIWWRKE